MQEAATRGVATPATALPFADSIQRAFGRHDISSVQAHIGDDAAASTHEMGAAAYATGNHVVLGEHADLFTVAHEAAHVVQQRAGVHLRGGVGEQGDAYEQHADEVAARVVQGRSVEGLLDEHTSGATNPGAASPAVQRQIFTQPRKGEPKPVASAREVVDWVTKQIGKAEAKKLESQENQKLITALITSRDPEKEITLNDLDPRDSYHQLLQALGQGTSNASNRKAGSDPKPRRAGGGKARVMEADKEGEGPPASHDEGSASAAASAPPSASHDEGPASAATSAPSSAGRTLWCGFYEDLKEPDVGENLDELKGQIESLEKRMMDFCESVVVILDGSPKEDLQSRCAQLYKRLLQQKAKLGRPGQHADVGLQIQGEVKPLAMKLVELEATARPPCLERVRQQIQILRAMGVNNDSNWERYCDLAKTQGTENFLVGYLGEVLGRHQARPSEGEEYDEVRASVHVVRVLTPEEYEDYTAADNTPFRIAESENFGINLTELDTVYCRKQVPIKILESKGGNDSDSHLGQQTAKQATALTKVRGGEAILCRKQVGEKGSEFVDITGEFNLKMMDPDLPITTTGPKPEEEGKTGEKRNKNKKGKENENERFDVELDLTASEMRFLARLIAHGHAKMFP